MFKNEKKKQLNHQFPVKLRNYSKVVLLLAGVIRLLPESPDHPQISIVSYDSTGEPTSALSSRSGVDCEIKTLLLSRRLLGFHHIRHPAMESHLMSEGSLLPLNRKAEETFYGHFVLK